MRALLVLVVIVLAGSVARADGLLVFAASSLQTALDPVAQDYTDSEIRISYASSAALARQIAAGAPADVIISANVGWMDWLETKGLIEPGSRADLFGNSLVLIRPSAGDQVDGLDFGTGRIAVGLTEAVPAGIYARSALQSLGLWEDLVPRLVETENVRVALALVAREDVDRAIVYASDAVAEPRVAVMAGIPAASHEPIVYPGAVVSGAGPGAQTFLQHLLEPEVQSRFAAAGFTQPGAAGD